MRLATDTHTFGRHIPSVLPRRDALPAVRHKIGKRRTRWALSLQRASETKTENEVPEIRAFADTTDGMQETGKAVPPRAATQHVPNICTVPSVKLTSVFPLVRIPLVQRACPFPNIANHVPGIDPAFAFGFCGDNSRFPSAVLVPDGDIIIPVVAPGITQTFHPSRRVLPFQFGWQTAAHPSREIRRH
jgi:hypothetical protein